MKLKNQVTSLELSKKLEELGVKQESLFWWVHYTMEGTRKMFWEIEEGRPDYLDNPDDKRKAYSAFTVAELINILPAYINPESKFLLRLRIEKHSKVYIVGYEKLYTNGLKFVKEDKFLINSMAKLLIYLKENKLI